MSGESLQAELRAFANALVVHGQWLEYVSRLSEAVALLKEQADEIAAQKGELQIAWRERNVAYAKVKGWESVVFVEGLPLRAVPVDEWGPGEGGSTSIPVVTPQKLTDLLDELAQLRVGVE